jgi:hypothetical protein
VPVMSFLRWPEAAWATVSPHVRYPMRFGSADGLISFACVRKLAQSGRNSVRAWAGRGPAPDREPRGPLGAAGSAP